MTALGREVGLVDDVRWAAFNEKIELIEREKQRLKGQYIHAKHASVSELNKVLRNPVTREHSLEELIRRPEMTYQTLMGIESLGPGLNHVQAAEQVEIQIKYAGYIERQKDEIAKTQRHEETLLPADFDYSQISGLSNEVVAKLS